jgi:glycosyltransferase involved in cell wall biosynthesis
VNTNSKVDVIGLGRIGDTELLNPAGVRGIVDPEGDVDFQPNDDRALSSEQDDRGEGRESSSLASGMSEAPISIANGDVTPASNLSEVPSHPAKPPTFATESRLAGKRAGMVVYSLYPADPRPRRAAEALLKEGMHIDLICEGDKESKKREILDRLEIIRIPIQHYRGGALSYAYQYSAFILISAAILGWRTLRRRYDLVYVHNMPDILVLCALLPKLFGAKVILDLHDPMPELMKTIFNMEEKSLAVRVMRYLEKWSIARADLVITVSVAFKRIFSARSCRAEKIGVVMNSPDGEIFPYHPARSNPARMPGKPFVIMYHGSLVERNGLGLAVDALARVHKTIPTAELRIYGRSTPYLEQVMDKVRSLNLDHNVIYLGAKSLEELVDEIECCDVGIIPNPRNTFTEINTPTRILEYLALGKPVVAPSTIGIQDYFTPDSLLFFEPGDSEDLADKIEYVASHAIEAIAIAERGQQVYQRHTWQQEKQTLVSLVVNLIEKVKPN